MLTYGDIVPGKQVKNWKQYHALRRKGLSKSSAARITNAAAKRKRRKKGSGRSAKQMAALRKAQLASAIKRRRPGYRRHG